MTAYRPSGFLAPAVVAEPFARGATANLEVGGMFVTERSGDLLDDVLLLAEETIDFAEWVAEDLSEVLDLAEPVVGDLPEA